MYVVSFPSTHRTGAGNDERCFKYRNINQIMNNLSYVHCGRGEKGKAYLQRASKPKAEEESVVAGIVVVAVARPAVVRVVAPASSSMDPCGLIPFLVWAHISYVYSPHDSSRLCSFSILCSDINTIP